MPAERATVTLRAADHGDIELFYQLQQDPVAVWMAAFTSAELADRSVFERRWVRVLADETLLVKTVLLDGVAIGQVLKYVSDQTPEVSYWIAREHWGHGYATEALRLLLLDIPQRPVLGRTAQDNLGSIGVLKRNGFVITGVGRAPAAARGELVDEYELSLS